MNPTETGIERYEGKREKGKKEKRKKERATQEDKETKCKRIIQDATMSACPRHE
jgi:hypothetical protein